MGGILIKQALINAHVNPVYSSIKDATSGLAFFATPQSGGDQTLVNLGRIAVAIANTVGFSTKSDVLSTLKKGSVFSDIMAEQWRHQLESYDIVSFWGDHDTVSGYAVFFDKVSNDSFIAGRPERKCQARPGW
jgi:hypothetical protein